mgnify:FL=1
MLNGEIFFEERSLFKRAQSFSVENCFREFSNLLNEA